VHLKAMHADRVDSYFFFDFVDDDFFEDFFELFFDDDFFELDFFDDDFFEDFFDGTLPPSRRASDNPMAMACLRLFTFFPLRPLFSVPRLRLSIARLTFFDAPFEYLRAIPLLRQRLNANQRSGTGRVPSHSAAKELPQMPGLG